MEKSGEQSEAAEAGSERTPLAMTAFLIVWMLLSSILFSGESLSRMSETPDHSFDVFDELKGTKWEAMPGAFTDVYNREQYDRRTRKLDSEIAFKSTMERASFSTRVVAMVVVALVDPIVAFWALLGAWLMLARHKTWLELNRNRTRKHDAIFGAVFFMGGALLMTGMFSFARLLAVPFAVEASIFLGRLAAMGGWVSIFVLIRWIYSVNNRLYAGADEPGQSP